VKPGLAVTAAPRQVVLIVIVALLFGSSCDHPVEAPGGETAGIDESFDHELLRLFNEARRAPRRCGSTTLAPAHTLAPDPALAAAARSHAEDLVERETLDHVGRHGTEAAARATAAGFDGEVTGEVIAQGGHDRRLIVATLLESAGHCRAIMDHHASLVGVAMLPTRQGASTFVWVVVFGTRASMMPSRS
jgi:uncharacterized protein YkwD